MTAPAGPGRAAALWCRGLRKRLGARLAVDGVGFEVRAGEAYGLVGPHGSGKTTIVRLACGLLAPDAGTVLARGRPVGALGRAERDAAVAYVPQSAVALRSLSLADNLAFWARLSGLGPAERHRRVVEALELAGLGDLRNVAAERCPGGVQRRLGLAVGLLHRPALLVLDDVTAGTDAPGRDRLLATLARVRDRGTAVLVTGRHCRELDPLCDRTAHMDAGRLTPARAPA